MKIAEWIKETREAKAQGPFSAARAIGVHRVTLARWEAGSRTPQVEGLVALARWAGVEVGALAVMR